MLNIVFTGPAVDNSGNSVVRANLIAACAKKGNINVQPAVRQGVNMLVASRTDTMKAKAAAARGLAVFTYPEFIAKFLAGVEIATGGIPNKFTDAVDHNLLAPDFTEGTGWAASDLL